MAAEVLGAAFADGAEALEDEADRVETLVAAGAGNRATMPLPANPDAEPFLERFTFGLRCI